MAGSNPFIGKSVPQAVQDELAARSGASGTIWTAQRFPWISVISMCKECSNSFELSNGKGNLYSNSATYQRPNPTITQLQVRKQGELGTTRKATVNITAYDDAQLYKLQQCFFIPGMSVRVQWGWSLSAAGKKAPEIYRKREVSDATAFCYMNTAAAEHPQYEGLQGLVTTFNYTLTQDGYWDCSLDIISAADSILETKTNYQCCDCPAEYEDEEDSLENKQKLSQRNSLLYSLLRLISFPTTGTVPDNIVTQSGNLKASMKLVNKEPYITRLSYEGIDRTIGGSARSGFLAWIKSVNYGTEETYMSWETLEAMINLYCFPTKKDDSPVIGRIVSTDIKLKAPYYIESTDPRICLLPGSKNFENILNAEEMWGGTLKGYQVKYGKTPIAVNKDSDNNTYVYLKDILVNCIMLMSELDAVEQSDGTLGTFLYNVLRKISDTCGGIWDFDIVSNTENCSDNNNVPTLTVIERKDTSNTNPYLVPSLPNNTVVRELKLDLKMNEAMKSQALYSNAPAEASNNCSKNTTCGSNAFKPFALAKVKGANQPNGVTNLAYPAATEIQAPPCDCKVSGTTSRDKTFEEYMVDLVDIVTDETSAAANNALIEKIARDTADNDSYLCSGIILPFNFEFTVDGIGGFKFGQIVSSTRIPASLRENYVWQVTAVEHTMNIQDWTTTVKTVARYNPKKSTAKPIKVKLAVPEELKEEADGVYGPGIDNATRNVSQDINPYINAINQGKVTIPGNSPVDFGPGADPNDL